MILSATNFWMCFAGLLYLFAGVFLLRKAIGAALGWDKFISLAPVFIAASLAAFAPEHFYGPQYIQQVVPRWMPVRAFWPYLIGCLLLAAATSLTFRKCLRSSTTLLGLMFFLFVCLVYLPSALAHPHNRFGWAYILRDLSFAGGAWSLAGLHSQAAWPRQSAWMITFGRVVLAIAAVYYASQHFLYPGFAPGVPSETMAPPWLPLINLWSYLAGAVLLVAGIGLGLNKSSRLAATAIGALMTVFTLLYLVSLIVAFSASSADFNDAINYVADTLLFAGTALSVASAQRYQYAMAPKPD